MHPYSESDHSGADYRAGPVCATIMPPMAPDRRSRRPLTGSWHGRLGRTLPMHRRHVMGGRRVQVTSPVPGIPLSGAGGWQVGGRQTCTPRDPLADPQMSGPRRTAPSWAPGAGSPARSRMIASTARGSSGVMNGWTGAPTSRISA